MTLIIDIKDALERVQDDKELLLELFDIFIEDFTGKYPALQEAQRKGDCVAFQMLAHGLKGATGNISAKQMHEICVTLDAESRVCNLGPLAEKVDLLGQCFEAFKVEAAKVKKEFGK
ncbi:MAG: Hpt domain-containing protein [Candidatus Omnitrophota bacterium]